jgi:hypothetical protein
MPSKDPEVRRAYRLANRDKIIAQQAEWREKNREATRQKDAERRAANREKLRAYDRALYAANPEPKKKYANQYRADHEEEIKRKQKERHAAHPEIANQRSIKWQKENRERRNARERVRHEQHPEKHRLRNERRRARMEGLPDAFSSIEEIFMRSYWNNACAICGRLAGEFHEIVADHWIPLAAYDCPGTVVHNMIPLCHGRGGCNNSKHYRLPNLWLEGRYGPAQAAVILARIAAYFTEVHRRFPQPSASAAD